MKNNLPAKEENADENQRAKDRGYLLRVLFHASLGKMNQVIREIHRQTGKNRVALFLDILRCAVKYGAGYYDYKIFAFYDLTPKQRETYVTRLWSKRFIEFMNDPKYSVLFDEKDRFYEMFQEYLGRTFLRLKKASKEEVREYVSSRELIFGKIADGECGHGCERLRISDFPDFDTLYQYLVDHFDTIEDVIVQHPTLSKLYANAVNTMRVITVVDRQGTPHCVHLVQKVGLNGSFVDNNCMFSPLDPETGKIQYPAHSGDTRKGIVYTEQPDTHIPLVGYQIPFVKEAIEMCLKAALVVPQMRYVGWDVAITENGPVIVEGNNYCAHDFWQLPPHTPDKIGMIPTFKKWVPEFPGK